LTSPGWVTRRSTGTRAPAKAATDSSTSARVTLDPDPTFTTSAWASTVAAAIVAFTASDT
jgi:hypothetical protein